MKRRTSPPKQKTAAAYRQLWRIVDAAVLETFKAHPDYLTERGAKLARQSINKRVVGAILGFAEESAKHRSGASPAVDTKGGGSKLPTPSPRQG